MKSAWLLEGNLGGGIIYWGHVGDQRDWTADAIEAAHFADERSAEIVLNHLSKLDNYSFRWFVVEHGFVDPPLAEPVVEAHYEGEEHA